MIKNRYIMLNRFDIQRVVEYYKLIIQLLGIIKSELNRSNLYVEDALLFELVLQTLPNVLEDIKKEKR
jgi:hypothetical protein